MDPNSNHGQRIRVVMFPWLAYSHITPYFELAKKLTATNLFTTYLCSTPANLTCIVKKITPNLLKSIKLIPLNLPSSQGLPPELHTTNGLPTRLVPKLLEALTSSSDVFSDTLARLKPDLLIYDGFQPWAAQVAKDQNIPAVEFLTCGATSTCHLYHQLLYPGVDFPFPKIYRRDYDDNKWLMEVASNPEKKKWVFEGAQLSSKIVLIKGSRDVEGKYMDYISSLMGKKYVAVGPLVQVPSHDDEHHDHEILSWLDKKERRSTVLFSFGSEFSLTKEEICEVAQGLELSKVNFIWILRFPKGESAGTANKEKALPLGFLDRVGDRGRILEWAPQTKILRHANVGGLASHCGWSSVMESMYFGVPIIAMPVHIDQPANARLIEEVGAGVEVLRDKNRRFRGETMAAVIRHVMVEDGGRFVRKRAAEIGEKLRRKEGEEMDQVVKELVSLCNN